jgi:hypothetical protein
MMKRIQLLIFSTFLVSACDKKPEFTLSPSQATMQNIPEGGVYKYSFGASGRLRYVGSFDTKPNMHSLFSAHVLSKNPSEAGRYSNTFVTVQKEMPKKRGFYYRSNTYENEAGEQHIAIIEMPFVKKK